MSFVINLIIVAISWLITYNTFAVERRVVYMRNGQVINVKGASKFTCYLSVACSVYLSASFIFTHVLPLL